MRTTAGRILLIVVAASVSVAVWVIAGSSGQESEATAAQPVEQDAVGAEPSGPADLALEPDATALAREVAPTPPTDESTLDQRATARGGPRGRVIDAGTRRGIARAEVGSRLALHGALLRRLEGREPLTT